MATVDICLNTICEQRKIQMLYNVPPVRYNPLSPYVQYPQFTKQQFDMRRKAEILEYSANKSNTKTNNLTKSQKWAQLINGGIKNKVYADTILQEMDASGIYRTIVVKYPDTYTSSQVSLGNDALGQPMYTTLYTVVKGAAETCDPDLVEIPTSSSDIPGPVINLYKDKSVPLYNYAMRTASYAILNTENTAKWVYHTNNDVFFTKNVDTTLLLLNINKNIDEYAYNFDITTPIGIYVNGQVSNIVAPTIMLDGLEINIQNIGVNVYYNNQLVTLQKQPTLTYTTNPVLFDISMNRITNYESYTGIFYVGNLIIHNLYLYTQPGYVYDIRLNVALADNFSSLASYTSNFNTFTGGIYCNLSQNNNLIQQNCRFTTPVSTTPNNGFSFSGS